VLQIRGSGGFECVLQLLAGCGPRSQRSVLLALAALTARNNDNKLYVVDCGGLELLAEVGGRGGGGRGGR
jgi:hypothetical protein